MTGMRSSHFSNEGKHNPHISRSLSSFAPVFVLVSLIELLPLVRALAAWHYERSQYVLGLDTRQLRFFQRGHAGVKLAACQRERTAIS